MMNMGQLIYWPLVQGPSRPLRFDNALTPEPFGCWLLTLSTNGTDSYAASNLRYSWKLCLENGR
jgi:hypothetical protein